MTGTGSVFGGHGPFSLSYPFSNYSDTMTANSSGALAFTGNQGGAAVSRWTGFSFATFWGFPWEALPTAADREATLQAFLDACLGGASGLFSDGFESGDSCRLVTDRAVKPDAAGRSTPPRRDEPARSAVGRPTGCRCSTAVEHPVPDRIVARLRIEKAGRRGKTVTVVESLPRNTAFLKELAAELKRACATGGKVIEDRIEIQGDHRERLRELLKAKGWVVKG